MDSLSKKLQNLGIHDIRNAARFAQNVIVQYEPYQIDIRRATNTDSWGPTPKHLAKVLRNRYQVPMYLMTEYILKRLIDHIAQRPKNLYEKARKQYVNYGSEWRVVLKCLVVLEFLLLNVDDGDELNQIKSCLNAHKHILTREVNNYKIKFSNDGKMEVHERGIKKKNELILQYLDDPHFLKRERLKNKKNSLKIKNNNAAGGYNNDLSDVTSSHRRYNHPSFSGDHVMDAAHGMGYDFDDDDDDFDDYVTSRSNKHTDLDDFDDEFNEFTVGTTQTSSGRATSSSSSSSSSSATPNHNVNTHNRRSQITSLEDQRRQRREILRERIRSTERQRKTREQMKLQQQQQQQQDIPDLLDLDFDSTPATNTNNNNDNNSNLTGAPISGTTNLNVFSSNEDKDHSRDDDDDGFGDFQSEPSTTPMSNNNISSNLNDLLTGNNINITTSKNNNNKTTSLNDKDLFADLFNNSKSLI